MIFMEAEKGGFKKIPENNNIKKHQKLKEETTIIIEEMKGNFGKIQEMGQQHQKQKTKN